MQRNQKTRKHMKVSINQNEFVARFLALRPEKFSLPALAALFDYLDAEEDALGEEQYLDVIGICCEWTEYKSALAAAEAYGFQDETAEEDERDSQAEAKALVFLCDETAVIELREGILVRDF